MNHRIKFDANWKYQEKYLPEVEDLITQYSYLWVDTRISTFAEDTKQATDIVSTSNAPCWAVRIRRYVYLCRYKDLTIRTYNRGYMTERDKLRDGHADYYFYGWSDLAEKSIEAFWIIDLDKLRESGLLDRTTTRRNTGGNTAFLNIEQWELMSANALLVDYDRGNNGR